MAQVSLFDDIEEKPTLVIHIDRDDRNSDWLKPGSRDSELAIHAENARKHKAEVLLNQSKVTTMKVQADVLAAKIDKAAGKEGTPEK